MAIEYREPWHEVQDDKLRAALQRQYQLEISSLHQLWDRKGFVIGQNKASDDVLVRLADGCFAIVHLVWSAGPGDAIYPNATLYPSASELSHALALDAENLNN